MTRESRLIVVLLVLSAAGVSGLMLVANQYRKALGPTHRPAAASSEDAGASAARRVEGFLAARAAARAAAGNYGSVRAQALAAHGMTYEDYAAVRTAWKRFREGTPVNDAALAAAFQARRPALLADDENAVQAPDEAIP
jgi:hypothetical protein